MSNKLYEYRTFDQANILLEKDSSTGNMFMNGIFIQGDTKNHNQRVYPVSEISKAVTNIQERIKQNGGVPGELDHPEELSINLDRVSHIIESMWLESNNGCGKLKIIPTPMGNIVKTLLESGAKLGVSSRGSGNVDGSGYVSDFDIVTVDVVAQPSAPDAYPKTIYESLYNMRGGSRLYEMSQQYTHNNDKTAQKYLAKDIMKFINELKKS